MEEIWKDVIGYEGFYQVSNQGRVKRLPYQTTGRTRGCKKEYIKKFPERIMKATICANGYYRVSLSKNGKLIYQHIHRLVAEAFIPNPNNYPCVNHKDEVKTNNNVNNLEWCSYRYNNCYGTVKSRFAEAYSKNHSRAVEMLSLFGEKIKEFPSIREAAIFVGGTATSICRAITRTRKTAYGYIWNLI